MDFDLRRKSRSRHLFLDGTFTTSLGGASVTINGKVAYLSYVSPNQINAQAPDDTATGAVPVLVTTANGSATGTANSRSTRALVSVAR